MQSCFADKLALVVKALALSRGQLAVALSIDKSLVSRWLSGASAPGNHNLARLTRLIAERVPGFTMLDWEADVGTLERRLGLTSVATSADMVSNQNGSAPFPDLARLPALASTTHETAALGSRYTGLWRTLVPSFSTPDVLHWEHLVLDMEHGWLAGRAIGYCYEWPAVGIVANGQLMLMLSDRNDYVVRLFSRVDGPIVEQLDGLMLAAASLPGQPPSCARIVMERVAEIADAEGELIAHASERRILGRDEPDAIRRSAVLCDGGLQRAGGDPRLIRTRWY